MKRGRVDQWQVQAESIHGVHGGSCKKRVPPRLWQSNVTGASGWSQDETGRGTVGWLARRSHLDHEAETSCWTTDRHAGEGWNACPAERGGAHTA